MALKILPEQGSPKLGLANLALRFLQFLFAAVVLVLLAVVGTRTGGAVIPAHSGKYGIFYAAPILSFITAVAFVLLPVWFGYRPLILILIWDFILLCIWAADFSLYKQTISSNYPRQIWIDNLYDNCHDALHSKCPLTKLILGIMWDLTWLMLLNLLFWVAAVCFDIGVFLHNRVRGSGARL